MIVLTAFDLSLAALLVVALALTSVRIYPGLAKQLLVAALRTAIQLTLIGLVLKTLFANSSLLWVAMLSSVMLAVAGREVVVRQQRRFAGGWGYAIGMVSMFISSFTVALFALVVVVANEPWYQPQYYQKPSMMGGIMDLAGAIGGPLIGGLMARKPKLGSGMDTGDYQTPGGFIFDSLIK